MILSVPKKRQPVNKKFKIMNFFRGFLQMAMPAWIRGGHFVLAQIFLIRRNCLYMGMMHAESHGFF
jgi:hypothetical protein